MNDSSEPARSLLADAFRAKHSSVRLAWAITAGEAVLLAALAVGLIEFWLMLPVLLRSIAALGLAGLTAVGVVRLVKFYRRPRGPGA